MGTVLSEEGAKLTLRKRLFTIAADGRLTGHEADLIVQAQADILQAFKEYMEENIVKKVGETIRLEVGREFNKALAARLLEEAGKRKGDARRDLKAWAKEVEAFLEEAKEVEADA